MDASLPTGSSRPQKHRDEQRDLGGPSAQTQT